MTDSTPDPWELVDGDPDEGTGAPRGRLPTISPQRPFLLDWINTNAGRPVPESLFDGTYRHPLPIATPAVLYVWDDPDDRALIRVRGCGTTGPTTLYPGQGIRHYGVLCGSFADQSCGPLRCMKLAEHVAERWHAVPALYLYRIDAPDLAALQHEDTERTKSERGRIVNAITERGGEHITIITQDSAGWHCFIFSTADHSTTRRNRGNPPRRVDVIPTPDALAHLHALLRGGIADRSASRSLELPDTHGMSRGHGRGDGIPLGQLGERNARKVVPTMRRLYAHSGGTKWPDDEPTPLDRPRDDLAQLGRDAVEAVKAADQVERAARLKTGVPPPLLG